MNAAVQALAWCGSLSSAAPSADPCYPAAVAVLFVTLLAAVAAWHWRDCAIGSTAIPPSIAVLPRGKPLLGHTIEIVRNLPRLHQWLLEQSRRFGYQTFAFTMLLLPTSFVVTDPACLQHVLKTKAPNYIKGKTFARVFKPLLGHGIFASDGDHWLWQRKLATNIFSVSSFKQYIDVVFGEKVELLHAVLLQAGSSGQPCDLHDLMHRFTLEAFAQLGFGLNLGSFTQQGKVPFAAAFDRAQAIVVTRFWLPAWPLVELLNGNWLVIRRCSAAVKRFALDVIKQRHAQLAAEHADHGPGQQDAAAARDLLSLFMAASGPDGQRLTDEQLVDAVLNFIIAGRDTTAQAYPALQALSWTFFLLMQHPEAEQKLLDEIHEVLGQQGGGGPAAPPVAKPSYEQIRQLHYARACFLEALRLYPSVPEDVKYAVDEDVLPDGSVIPNGAQVIYSPFLVNRMTQYWGEDADDFRPERWLRLQELPSPYSYLSFNAGPRICLGQRLAQLEGVYVLVSLLARFRFRPAQPLAQVTYVTSTTLPMKGGLPVMVEERA